MGHTPGLFFNLGGLFCFDFLQIFFVFVNMGSNGSEISKPLLLQIAAKSFETYPEFSSQWSSQNYFWDFWNSEFPTFNDFFVLTPLVTNYLLCIWNA